jgi:hypothetical protein
MVIFEEIKVLPTMPFDFMTHLNYISCMKELSKGLELNLNIKIDSKSSFKVNSLKKKIRLICLIKESLDEEYKKAEKEKDFARVCSMWISVKSYYLIFNMLLIIHVLINSDETNLNYTHSETINKFRNLLKSKKLEFNKEEFNIVSSCGGAFLFRSESGDTLKKEVLPELRARSVLKKLCKYKLEDFCRYKGIKNFKKKKARLMRDSFLRDSEISLFEFFYWYRIKTNYRDLAFLDQKVFEGDVAKFYENYYILTINFYDCLRKLINELSKSRLGEDIIK